MIFFKKLQGRFFTFFVLTKCFVKILCRMIAQRGPEAKNSTLFLWHYFNDFMEKTHVARFVVFWSVLPKLWNQKALNSTWVTLHPRMYKTFHSWFTLNIFVNIMEKEPFNSFSVVWAGVHFLKVQVIYFCGRNLLND